MEAVEAMVNELWEADVECPDCGYMLMVNPETMDVTCSVCGFKGKMSFREVFQN